LHIHTCATMIIHSWFPTVKIRNALAASAASDSASWTTLRGDRVYS